MLPLDSALGDKVPSPAPLETFPLEITSTPTAAALPSATGSFQPLLETSPIEITSPPPARAPARRRARHRRAERAPRQSPEGGRSLSGRQRPPAPQLGAKQGRVSYLSMMSDSVVIALVGKLFCGPMLHQGGCGKHPHRAQGQ